MQVKILPSFLASSAYIEALKRHLPRSIISLVTSKYFYWYVSHVRTPALHFMVWRCITIAAHSMREELVRESCVLQKVLNIVVANAGTSEMTAQSNLNRWHFIHIPCLIWNIIVLLEIYKALLYFSSKLSDWQILLSLLYRLEDVCLMDGIGVLLKVGWKVVGHQAVQSPTGCSQSSVSWSTLFCIAPLWVEISCQAVRRKALRNKLLFISYFQW